MWFNPAPCQPLQPRPSIYPLLDPKYPYIGDHIPLFEDSWRVLENSRQGPKEARAGGQCELEESPHTSSGPQLKETKGGEFRVYRASIWLL